MNATIVDTPENVEIKRKMQLSGKIVKIALAGAIVDISQEKPAILHISQLEKKHGQRVEDVLEVGQEVDVWVRRIDPKSKNVELTMIKPLALEWREIKKGNTIKGKVVRIEKFGVFVDIGAERPGLIHISELSNEYIRSASDVVSEGDEVEVKILAVNRRKKQIKLSMKAMISDPIIEDDEEEDDSPVPSAMEFALRQAMQQNDVPESSPESETEPGEESEASEMDDIISRTLEHKERSGGGS